MKRQIAVLSILVLVLVATFPAAVAQAQEQPPPVPHAFYGFVEVNGQPAPVGAKVEARGENVLSGNEGNPFVVTATGKYGGPTRNEAKLIVQGLLQDDQPIEFYVDGVKAQCAKPGEAWQDGYRFIQGVVTELNLRVGSGQQQVESSPTPTATQTSTAQATAIQVSITEATATQAPTATRQTQTTTTAVNTSVPTAATQLTAAVQSPQPTPLPRVVLSKPTEQSAHSKDANPSPVPPIQTIASTVTPAATEVSTIAPTSSAPATPAPKTPVQVAARPNATVQPILAQAKPPEAVESALSQTTNGIPSRTAALWGGLGALLIAIAIGILIKVRGFPR